MSGARTIDQTLRGSGRFTGGVPLGEQSYRKLVVALFAEPLALWLATLISAILTGTAAFTAQSVHLFIGFLVTTALGVSRTAAICLMARRIDAFSSSLLARTYAAGAVAYAAALGLFAATTMIVHPDAATRAAVLAFTLAFAVALGARDASRPAIAMAQPVAIVVPLLFALLAASDTAYLALAICMALALPAMGMVVHGLYRSLHDSIAAAETSAQLAAKMQVLARTDVVTGLVNRAGLNHSMAERLAGLPTDHRLALFWLDLDRFKEVNDVLGHQVGDRVLAEVAKRFRAVAPADALIARFGGDEFIMLCTVDDRLATERLADRVLAGITRPMRIEGQRLEVPASMGIALLPDDGSDIDSLMQAADLALYHAKIGGKNHSRFYEKSMSRELVRRREIEVELRTAIQRDELSIFFQPIVDLATGRIRTFEALVRWFHPEKGELRPDEFIPLAEETGVIVTLGNWITREAARAATMWPADVSVAVNLSPLQIKAPGAALGILSALRETGLDPARLELEVTERLFLEDDQATANFMTELSEVGVKFALDDFGTGYSSLGYIDKYPFHTIKVDRSFVSGPNVGRSSAAIIRAVAELGAQLDMAIVAEGLETLEQVRSVRAAGCTLGQGYYFSRAVPDYLAVMLLAHESDEGLSRVG